MRRYYSTIYGYVMYTFSIIDFLSAYLEGNNKDQTNRMEKFMQEFMDYGKLETKFAVKEWRHTLMHTSEPRVFLGSKSKKKYYWLLHWGLPYLPREQYMEFQESSDLKILNMGLLYIIEDLKLGLQKLIKSIDESKVLKYQQQLENQKFKEL